MSHVEPFQNHVSLIHNFRISRTSFFSLSCLKLSLPWNAGRELVRTLGHHITVHALNAPKKTSPTLITIRSSVIHRGIQKRASNKTYVYCCDDKDFCNTDSSWLQPSSPPPSLLTWCNSLFTWCDSLTCEVSVLPKLAIDNWDYSRCVFDNLPPIFEEFLIHGVFLELNFSNFLRKIWSQILSSRGDVTSNYSMNIG